MFHIQRTQDVSVSVRCRVQHRVVIRVVENYGFYDHGLHQLGGVGEGSGKECRLRRRDPVTFAESRVHQDAFNLVENKSRQDEGMSAEDMIRKTQRRTLWAGKRPNKYVGIEGDSQARELRVATNASSTSASISSGAISGARDPISLACLTISRLRASGRFPDGGL